MHNSTESKRPRKPTAPKKPWKDFPLWAHSGSGMWARKIGKRVYYFGSWRRDPKGDAAIGAFNREWEPTATWPYFKQRTPAAVDVSNGCTLRQLCNDFLRSKEELLKADDLSPRTFRDYYKTCETVIEHFGKDRRVDELRPDDFRNYRAKLAGRLGVVSLKNEINRACILFNHAHANNLIAKPVSYGSNFERPSAKALRRDRNEAGPKLFEQHEVLRILDALEGKPVVVEGKDQPVTLRRDPVMKAMFLLSLNGGLGNTDVANLRESHVDFKNGWLDYPRVKTEIPRRIPLWNETLKALEAALAIRPVPADPSAKGLVFLTRSNNPNYRGRPWVRVKRKLEPEKESDESAMGFGPEASVPIDALSGEFKKVLRKLEINHRRGLGFYSGRHTFETQAGESKDQVAVDAIMGHVDPSMAATYRHRISDERLRAVVETVRRWLFGAAANQEGGAA